jgi:phosphatidylserine decarboxylase
LLHLLQQTIPPIHPDGRPFIATGLALAGLGLRTPWLRRLGLGVALATAAFFRMPRRVTPTDPSLIISAADGQVSLIDEAVPPAELEWTDQPRPRVSTFLSLTDVHVQRSPVSGTVIRRAYAPGHYLSADRAEASQVNERNGLVVKTADGDEIGVVQIAGLIARRIVCQVDEGDAVTAGQTYGLIRFGSRVDLYLPPGAQPQVAVGQRLVGGETVVAKLP